ncbi:MAG: FKBP-type peptidyl-prolyl cis-trans isomerase [Bacteroidaceae bacterium]|nr:FKBP-type peptidyl-prolyl cis-trans isomerase [Bacteroidaceae bacterium]
MKKASVLLAFVAAMGFVSCNGQSPKANLKSDVDTLSYTIGMAQTQGLKDYLVGRLGVDTAYMDDFMKGLKEAAYAGDDKAAVAYYAGIQIGQQVGNQMFKGLNQQVFGNDSTQTISLDNFLAGFIAGIDGKGLMSVEDAQNIAQAKMEAIQAEQMEKQYGPNKKAGEEFLAKKAKEEGVKSLEGGVLYKVITEGKGEMPKSTDKVKVNYKGTLVDGTEFDSSYSRNEPASFRADQVIKGWTTALTNMPVGSKWEVYIPQDLGYGSREAGTIPPFSTLVFEIELLEIEAE